MKQPLALRALAPLGLVAIFGAIVARKVGDFDLPWHLATGRLIVARMAIPRVDDLAYTHRPVEHVDVLSDVPFWAIYQAFGPLGLQLFTATVSVATAVVLHRTAKDEGAAAWLAVALGMASMGSWLTTRPATIGFLFLALLMLVITRYQSTSASGESTRGHLRRLRALPLLFFVWANTHPSVFIGVVIVLGYAAYRGACHFARGRAGALLPAADGSGALAVAIAAALSVAVAMICPGGTSILVGPLRAHADFDLVTEWAKPTLSFVTTVEPATGVLLFAALLALVFGKGPQGRVPNAFDIGVVLLAFALSATAVRLLAVGAVLLAPFVARRFSPFVRPSALMHACAGLSLGIVAAVMVVKSDVGLGIGFEASHYPEAAVLWIKQNKPVGHMYNFMPFGGYLGLRLYPEHRVLIDGRQTFVHGHVLSEKVDRASGDPTALSELMSQYDIQWAITRSHEGESFGMTFARSSAFAMVFFDDVAAVYVKSDGPNEALGRSGYQVYRHLMPLEVALRAALQGQRSEEWSHDGTLAITQAPASPRAHFLDACGAIGTQDRGRFDKAMANVAELAPTARQMREVLETAWAARNAPSSTRP